MNAAGVLLGLHPKVGLILSVDESRETQNASGISGRRIASEFACHGTQQGLAVFPVNTLDPPHDLEFVRRCIYGVIRRRHQVGLSNLRQGRRAIVINVQVKMTDGLNVPLSSRARLGFQGVHSDVDVA
jgi:hypothetical protein